MAQLNAERLEREREREQDDTSTSKRDLVANAAYKIL
jgi:hypothetical protein